MIKTENRVCELCTSNKNLQVEQLGEGYHWRCTNSMCTWSRRLTEEELQSYMKSTPTPREEESFPLGHQLKEDNPVNHPSHYTSHPSGIECITITRHHDFAVGNAMKYMWRAGLKDSSPEKEIEDLEKAKWYLNDRISQLKKEQEDV